MIGADKNYSFNRIGLKLNKTGCRHMATKKKAGVGYYQANELTLKQWSRRVIEMAFNLLLQSAGISPIPAIIGKMRGANGVDAHLKNRSTWLPQKAMASQTPLPNRMTPSKATHQRLRRVTVSTRRG